MLSFFRHFSRATTACLLITVFAVPPSLLAQTPHVVSPSDIHKEVLAATQSRSRNLETVDNFLSSSSAEKALNTARLDSLQVKTAVATLSDAELAQLASRADKAQKDFAGGALTERDLLIIILGIAVLVLIIVAVR